MTTDVYAGVVGNAFATPPVETLPPDGPVSTSPLSVWYEEIKQNCPGATNAVADSALVAAFREFCVVSGAWLRQLPPIDIVGNTSQYTIPAIEDARPLYIYAMLFTTQDADSTRLLLPVQPITWHKRRMAAVTAGTPQVFYGHTERAGVFSVLPTPGGDIPEALTPIVCLGPKSGSITALPEFMQNWHYDTLLDGAIGRMFNQRDKPYSSMTLGQYHLRRFRTGMSKARDMVRRGMTTADTDFQFPRW